jgi:hypothetical protein
MFDAGTCVRVESWWCCVCVRASVRASERAARGGVGWGRVYVWEGGVTEAPWGPSSTARKTCRLH